MKQLLQYIYTYGFKPKRCVTSLLVAVALCVLPWWAIPSQAEGPEIGVLLPSDQLSRGEKELLLSLKQVYPNFSTIQLKELTNFKGKIIIAPLTDDTPSGFLEVMSGQYTSSQHVMLLPMLTKPNTPIEHFIEGYGYTLEGSQYLSRSLPLVANGSASSRTFIPIGSFLLKLSSQSPALASWGTYAPAALVSGKSLLLNWNWNAPFPEAAFTKVLEDWQNQDRSLVLNKQPVSIAMTGAAFASGDSNSRISPELPTENVTRPAYWETTSGQTHVSEAKNTSDPQVPPTTSAPESSNSQSPTENRAVSKPQPEETADTDSNPDELYDFDGGGGGKASRETIAKRRSLETQNAIAEYYNDRMRELAELQDKVNMLAAQNLNHPEKNALYQSALQNADLEKSKFENAWFQQNFGPALSSFEKSKATLLQALFEKVPTTLIEGRAIWLDRGSIVKSASEEGLRQLIRRISTSGFNVIYFETVNAGYPIYPSALVEQNPQTKGWDPLAIAVDEAHKQGVELHAWVWVFAVGNTRHNKILGQSPSFPGPILSKGDMASEVLRGRNGEIVLPAQFEYWLSPASFKARGFLISLYSEIVKNYNVDGLQLDYIRYPFQKPNTPMGFEPFAASRFTSETGLSLGEPNEYTMKAWDAWKAFQVTTFVKELNHKLKAIKPEIKLSAAVFPMARHGRMLMIQQDWETWVRNGWIDTINPMAYSRSSRSLERLVQYIHNVGDDKALVYPGLSLSKLNAVELLDVLEVCRRTGVMGTTLFAVTQFDNDKQMLLQAGPYKQKKVIPPHRDPLGASAQLIAETQGIVDSLLKSEQPQPGSENLREIQQSLKSMGTAVGGLTQKEKSKDAGYLISAIRDDSRLLQQSAEQWAEWGDDSVAGYQAKFLKQMVEKVVRMVNYATFQLSTTKPGS